MVTATRTVAPLGISLKSLVNGFVLTKQTEGKSPRTVEFYSENLKRFLWYAQNQDWPDDAIVILDDMLEQYFDKNPKILADLFSQVRVVIAEFGESIGQFAATAAEYSAIGVVGIRDAADVLETGMHLRIEATENQCDIFFID